MRRSCPFCSRRLEDVAVLGSVIHCCPNCSIAWRSGAVPLTTSHASHRLGAALVCPDCGDRDLVPMGTTALGEGWRCLACHGRLVRISASAVSPPPLKGSDDDALAVIDGPLGGILVEAFAVALEIVAGALS